MRTSLVVLVATVGLIASALSVAAAGNAANTSTEARNGGTRKADKADVSESVTIEAHREKLWQLNQALNKSVNDFYDALSKASTVPSYRTRCDDEKPIGSLIPRHVCTPQFVDDANDNDMSSFLTHFATMPAQMLIKAKMPAYKKYMQHLIHTDPTVRQAALNFEALFERYQAVSREKVKGQ